MLNDRKEASVRAAGSCGEDIEIMLHEYLVPVTAGRTTAPLFRASASLYIT